MSRRRLSKNDIVLKLLHDGTTHTFKSEVFEAHFQRKHPEDSRKRHKGATILDIKEVIALRYLGRDSHREVEEVSVWLDNDELKDEAKIDCLFGKTATVVIESKDANEDLIKIHKHYELDDGRKGQCHFFGHILRKPKGNWVGLALWEGEGKNDGSVYGKYYFRCKEGKGIFVRPHRIKAEVSIDKPGVKTKHLLSIDDFEETRESMVSEHEMKVKRERLSSLERDIESDSDWTPYDAGLKPDLSNAYNIKTLYTQAQLHKHYDEKADHKMTIKEFQAWIKTQPGWQAANFQIKDTGQSKGLYHTEKKLHMHDNEHAARKLGPQEIGHADNFKTPHYELNMDDIRYDITYLVSKLRKNEGKKADHKLGPQEIGINENYNEAHYELNMDDIRYDLNYTMKDLHKNDGKTVQHKQGPQEIGKADDFKEAHYKLNLADTRYDISYTLKKLHEHDGMKADHKKTLAEIGTNDDYDVYDGPITGVYDGGIDSNSPKNLYHTLSSLHKNDSAHAQHRETLAEIGDNSGYRVYDGPITGTYEGGMTENSPRNLYHTLSNLNKNAGARADHKPTQAEIGNNRNYKVYRTPASSGVERNSSYRSSAQSSSPRYHQYNLVPQRILSLSDILTDDESDVSDREYRYRRGR